MKKSDAAEVHNPLTEHPTTTLGFELSICSDTVYYHSTVIRSPCLKNVEYFGRVVSARILKACAESARSPAEDGSARALSGLSAVLVGGGEYELASIRRLEDRAENDCMARRGHSRAD